ncbi:Crp/Fnr family transcriptional regulator [Olivibacter sp. SDN3]|uniref:Crp/Fnr family transcriptional regulator n=1 Tax=Olivibacter sp. SDN3 TaxID=2764720 RepID=UPI0016511D33|nr:Crp/Fnr family transcriptional regulator [Olivibacter sp. SDN3]QNL49689.1 Crp/Fnr family transcriptional regulator [Olivibacter sp. SDN3]
MKKDRKCDLSCFMCRHVLKEWLPTIASQKKNMLLKKGQQFIQEGDPVTGIYFVHSGTVKVHKQWGNKEMIIRFAQKGSIVGHRGIATKTKMFPISATALEPSLVCFIDLDFFISTLKVNTDFTYELMMFYADELQLTEQKLRNLAHMKVKARLAWAIIKLYDSFGISTSGFINIQLSKQDLASYVGTTYETVFRMINELVADKIIATDGRKIYIKHLQKLKAITEDES